MDIILTTFGFIIVFAAFYLYVCVCRLSEQMHLIDIVHSGVGNRIAQVGG